MSKRQPYPGEKGIYLLTGSQYQYQAVYRGPDGKQHAKSFRTLNDARTWRRTQIAAIEGDRWADPARGKVPLGDVVQDFLGSRRDLEAATLDLYQRRARMVLDAPLAGMPVGRIRRQHVESFLNDLETGRIWRRGTTGLTTVAQVRRFLSVVFESLRLDDVIARNPAAGIKTRKPEKRAPRILDESEVDRLADAIHPRYRAAVLLMAWCGLRVGEMAGLRVGDLDLRRGMVTVERSVKEVSGVIHNGTTKTDQVRSFPIPGWLAGELRGHLEASTGATAPVASGQVFPSPDGYTLRPNTWRRRFFYPAVKRAGIEPAPRPHDLRHTAASLMARAGFPSVEIQAVLGHGSASMSAYYTHMYQAGLRDRMAGFGADHRAGSGEVIRLPKLSQG